LQVFEDETLHPFLFWQVKSLIEGKKNAGHKKIVKKISVISYPAE
jgi:hypothetical protein